MSAATKVVRHPESPGHFVQLYGDETQSLFRNVAQYLSQGLHNGEGALVIASDNHRLNIQRALEGFGVDTQQALDESRLLLLDAHRTLSTFMVDRTPHWQSFEGIVKGAMSQLQSNGAPALRVYGEMVGILWAQYEYAAALRIEEYWNQLLKRGGFSLFCSYPLDLQAGGFQPAAIDALLVQHTHLLPASDKAHFESSILRAMDEWLGPLAANLRTMIQEDLHPCWAVLPVAERLILSLRMRLPHEAGHILSLARTYQRGGA